jgi:hypothetical protein
MTTSSAISEQLRRQSGDSYPAGQMSTLTQ